jgi:hypothetical protein
MVIFWPDNKRFFSLHTTLFHQSTTKLDSQGNVLSLVLPKPMPQFNEEFGISLKLQLLASPMEIVATTSLAMEIVHLTT